MLFLEGSNSNTYTGLTTVSEGTLVLAKENEKIAIPGNVSITSNGVLQLEKSNQIATSSQITLSDQGVFDLNDNSATIASLACIENENNSSSVSLGSGTLTVGTSSPTLTNAAFSGTIKGTGGFTKTGTSTLELNGSNANTYTGLTTVSGGTLQLKKSSGVAISGNVSIANGTLETIGHNQIATSSHITISDLGSFKLNEYKNTIASLAGSGAVSLSTGTLTVGTSTGTTTFSGKITGTGGFTKIGASTQVLNGENTYTGQTNINGGKLVINGTTNSHQTLVNNGGILGGLGKIKGDVSVKSGGIIAPGTSVGTLHIDGDLNLEPGSRTEIELLPTNEDQLNLVGHKAFISGELHLFTFAEVYPPSKTYTILRANSVQTNQNQKNLNDLEFDSINSEKGNVTNNAGFESINTDFAELFKVTAEIQTLPNISTDIILTVRFIAPSISDDLIASLTGNRKILANYFNSDPLFFFNTIFPLSKLKEKELKYFLDGISPARLSASTASAISVGFAQNQFTVAREQQTRFLKFRKSKETDSAIAVKTETLNGLVAQRNFGLPCEETKTAVKNDFSCAGYGNWTTQVNHEKRQHQNPAFNTFSSQGNVGIEKCFTNGLVGVAGSYGNTWISQDTESEVKVYGSTLYGIGYIENAFIDLSFSLYGLSFKSNRRVPFPSWARTDRAHPIIVPARDDKVSSNHIGYECLPHIGTGYDFGFQWGVIEPYISFDWAYVHENSFLEKGSSFYNFQIYKKHGSMLRSQAGLSTYQAFDRSWGTLFLKQELAYVHLKPFSFGNVSGTIPGSGRDFTVFALTKNQSRGKGSFEFFFKTNNGPFFSAQYSAEIGSKAFGQRVSATLGKYF